MKKILYLPNLTISVAILFCSMIISTGCAGYSLIGSGPSTTAIPPQDNRIEVTTIDGRSIDVKEYHFLAVRQPANFIYGVGLLSAPDSSQFTPYRGKIDAVGEPTEVILEHSSPKDSAEVFKLRDGSTARILKSELIYVDSSKGTGLWCVGLENGEHGRDIRFSGRIPFDQIKTIEVRRFWQTTEFKVIAVVGAVVCYWVLLDGLDKTFKLQ